MGLLPDTQNCWLRMRREFRERFPRHRFQRKPLVSDPGMHHDTCVTHVPWCMSGSLTRGGGENVPGIPGACAIHNFVRGSCIDFYTRNIYRDPCSCFSIVSTGTDLVNLKIPKGKYKISKLSKFCNVKCQALYSFLKSYSVLNMVRTLQCLVVLLLSSKGRFHTYL